MKLTGVTKGGYSQRDSRTSDKIVRPETFDPGTQGDLKRLTASGRLRLGGDLTPGEYLLQVIVTDALAPERERTVTQWTDFEIIG